MRVVDLDHRVVVQIVEFAALLLGLVQNQPRCVAHHEILLVNAQQTPRIVAVVGIEEQR